MLGQSVTWSIEKGCVVTDERFDELTRRMSAVASRRTVLKGVVATALGGAFMRVRGSEHAAARARVRMACARLGQPCDTVAGTPGNKICCPHLACDTDLTCCKPENESCVSNDDCCGDTTCRPNPTGLGNRCLPAGGVGATCVENSDCAAGLACEPVTGQCGLICGTTICMPGQTCDDYSLTCINLLAESGFGDATGGNPTWHLSSDVGGLGYGGVEFVLNAPINLAQIEEMSTGYTFDTGDSCCGGSPRFALGTSLGPNNNISVYIGPTPNFTLCPSNTPQSTGNLIGSLELRWDTSQIPGGTFYDTYANAVTLLNGLSAQITSIILVADGSWCSGDGSQGVSVDPTVILF